MQTPQNVLSDLKVSGNLPSMPQVLVQLLDICKKTEVEIQEIAGIVDKDAALSAKVLQLVNSAFIGARKTIGNIEQAVVYLGTDTVRNLAISISVQQVFRRVETNGLLSMDRFWHHSYTNALLARNIAEAINYSDPSEAYLAGLLHDIGKLLLWMAFPGRYAPLLLKGIRCHNARLAFLEEEKLHVNHCQAGAWLCEEWHLPLLIADAIRYHHHAVDEVRQSLPLTKIICFADLLSHNEPDAPECVETAEQLFAWPKETIAPLLEGIDKQIEQLADQLGIRIPSMAISSQSSEAASEEAHRETSLELISRVREISQLGGLLDGLLRAEDRQQIVFAVEQGMKILFNEQRCLLLLADETADRLSAAPSAENSLGREAEGLVFHAGDSPDSLLAQAIHAGCLRHSFMASSGTQSPPHLFDAQLCHLLGTEGMAIVPLTCHGHLEELLLIGLMRRSFGSLTGQAEALQLVANQAAVALQLDRVRRRQAERIAEERLQAATLVARKIGHEINNPLAILRNYLHILGRKLSEGQDVGGEMAIIDEEMERLARITLGLGDLSRENAPPCFETVELQPLLEKILAPFRASLPPESKVRIHLEIPEPSLQVTLDPGYLRQILYNLIKNALEAVQDQGEIAVRAEIAQQQIHIHVEDNGPGIPTERQNDLFNAGVSTKNSAHRGLGLSIAASLARQMRGNLRCSSTGEKTIFSLVLPLESA